MQCSKRKSKSKQQPKNKSESHCCLDFWDYDLIKINNN